MTKQPNCATSVVLIILTTQCLVLIFVTFLLVFLKVFSLISQFPSGTFPYPAGQHSMSFIKNYVLQNYIQ